MWRRHLIFNSNYTTNLILWLHELWINNFANIHLTGSPSVVKHPRALFQKGILSMQNTCRKHYCLFLDTKYIKIVSILCTNDLNHKLWSIIFYKFYLNMMMPLFLFDGNWRLYVHYEIYNNNNTHVCVWVCVRMRMRMRIYMHMQFLMYMYTLSCSWICCIISDILSVFGHVWCTRQIKLNITLYVWLKYFRPIVVTTV